MRFTYKVQRNAKIRQEFENGEKNTSCRLKREYVIIFLSKDNLNTKFE